MKVKWLLWRLALIAGAVWGGSWIIDHDGTMVIEWQEYRVEGSFVFGAVVLALVMALTFGAAWLGLYPQKWRLYRRLKRVEKRAHLSHALLRAVMQEEYLVVSTLLKQMRVSEKDGALYVYMYEKRKLATHSADNKRKLYEKWLSHEAVGEIALKDLLSLAIEEEDKETWREGFRQLLGKQMLPAWLPPLVKKAQDHEGLRLSPADMMAWGSDISQRATLYKLWSAQPSLTDIAVILIQHAWLLQEKNQAIQIVKKSWEARPHVSLAIWWLSIHQTDKAQRKINYIEKLEHIGDGGRDSSLALAHLALREQLGEIAEAYLDRIMGASHPCAYYYQLRIWWAFSCLKDVNTAESWLLRLCKREESGQ